MIIALCAFQLPLTSNRVAAILDFAKIWRLQESFVLAPVKNRQSMVLATSMPNMVILEESEPNTIYIALTAPTIGLNVYHVKTIR